MQQNSYNKKTDIEKNKQQKKELLQNNLLEMNEGMKKQPNKKNLKRIKYAKKRNYPQSNVGKC